MNILEVHRKVNLGLFVFEKTLNKIQYDSDEYSWRLYNWLSGSPADKKKKQYWKATKQMNHETSENCNVKKVHVTSTFYLHEDLKYIQKI